jgi:hypothetical protein
MVEAENLDFQLFFNIWYLIKVEFVINWDRASLTNINEYITVHLEHYINMCIFDVYYIQTVAQC